MRRKLGLILGVLLPLLLWFFPPDGLSPQGQKALSLSLFAILFYVIEPIPPALTSLLFMLLLILLGVVGPEVAFSGFTAPAFWLVFSSFLIAAGVLKSGLARRLALFFLRAFGLRYDRVLMGFCLVGFLLTFLVPSANGRIAILAPIALEVARAFQLPLRSTGAAALMLAMGLSAFFPGFALLPSNVPNLVHVGVAEGSFGIPLYYAQWAYLHLPVLGVVKTAMVFLVIRLLLWPKERPTLRGDLMGAPGAPLSLSEWKVVVLLGLALFLWATDFLHGIKPSWVGLGVAVALALPGIGVLEERDLPDHVNLPFLLHLGAVLGLGAVLKASGFSDWAGDIIFRVVSLSEMSPAGQVAAVGVIPAFLAILTTHPALPAVFTPIVIAYAQARGLDVTRLLFAEVIGISVSFFPYQTPPLILTQGFGAYTLGQVHRVLIPYGLLSLVLGIPLTLLYWWGIGFLE